MDATLTERLLKLPARGKLDGLLGRGAVSAGERALADRARVAGEQVYGLRAKEKRKRSSGGAKKGRYSMERSHQLVENKGKYRKNEPKTNPKRTMIEPN